MILLLIAFGRNSGDGAPADAPNTVMILLIDKNGHPPSYVTRVIENRKEYAEAHGISPPPPPPLVRKREQQYQTQRAPQLTML